MLSPNQEEILKRLEFDLSYDLDVEDERSIEVDDDEPLSLIETVGVWLVLCGLTYAWVWFLVWLITSLW